jgi:non-lysosomal glucosylceramidase
MKIYTIIFSVMITVIGTHFLKASDAIYVESIELKKTQQWPILKHYDQDCLLRVAMPLGGIGTGTISLGGRGDLRDWEIVNRPAKGFIPVDGEDIPAGPFFAIYTGDKDGNKVTRAVEGSIELSLYEGPFGSPAVNHGLPRFRHCHFEAAYPLGQVCLSDPDVPVDVTIKAFNPFVPGDIEKSGIPVAIFKIVVENKTDDTIETSVCGNIPNFIGTDGSRGWPRGNKNEYKMGEHVRGIFLLSDKVPKKSEQWGTIALTTTELSFISHRTSWTSNGWSGAKLDFWDDFGDNGRILQPKRKGETLAMASLAVSKTLKPRESKEIVFMITWHFPNRITWTPAGERYTGQMDEEGIENNEKSVSYEDDIIDNYYTTKYKDAWDVAEKVAEKLDKLEHETVSFVSTFVKSDVPEVVKEAALFNTSTLRTQTCFRTADGHFFGFEGCSNRQGCCEGSCTHVWNYEQATAFLFIELAKSMREVSFGHATDEQGLMSFRVHLPLSRAQNFGKAAADGQMGSIMRMYRDWQLSGDDEFLKKLWPKVKRALEFAWIKGGWDANKDGVMEGCQHNTMDVNYYGPNPQMQIWYLGALRCNEEMARYLGDKEFADTCKKLFERGSNYADQELFNGAWYEHKIVPPGSSDTVAPFLRVHGAGPREFTDPDFQLGTGCLVDQLVGQFQGYICDVGYLVKKENIQKTLESIMRYNYKPDLANHFNNMRSFALGNEAGLLMATFPKKDRLKFPFPYFNEIMTGFEYSAAVCMLYEGQMENGLLCIQKIRDRYDGRKRNPFNEAECGHHYARAMASWAAYLALTGFNYSAVEKTITFANQDGSFFWSNGSDWGNCIIETANDGSEVEFIVLGGELTLKEFILRDLGSKKFDKPIDIKENQRIRFKISS